MKKIRCWNCSGKTLKFGYAHPGDPKPDWHPCLTCKGKGWTVLTEGYQEKLADALYWDSEDETDA